MHGELKPLRQQSTLLKASGHCKIITASQWWCVLMSNTAVKILLRCWVPKRNGVSPLWRFTVCTRHLFSIHTRNSFFYSSMNNVRQVKPWKNNCIGLPVRKKERPLHTGRVMNECFDVKCLDHKTSHWHRTRICDRNTGKQMNKKRFDRTLWRFGSSAWKKESLTSSEKSHSQFQMYSRMSLA